MGGFDDLLGWVEDTIDRAKDFVQENAETLAKGAAVVGAVVAAPVSVPAAAVVMAAKAVGVATKAAGAAATVDVATKAVGVVTKAVGVATAPVRVPALGAAALSTTALTAVAVTAAISAGKAVAIGLGTLVAGIVFTAAFTSKLEDAKTEGVKEGYQKALQASIAKHRKQAKVFKRQIDEMTQRLEEITAEKSAGRSVTKKIRGWMLDKLKLHGNLIGYIKGRKEKGDSDEDLKEFSIMEIQLATEEKKIRKLCSA